jgi:hypothetical protein
VAIAAAGLGVLVGLPILLLAGLFLFLSSVTLDGCEVDLGPTPAGVSADPSGAVRIHVGPCGRGRGFESVRVRAPDGTVVWQADGTAGADEDPATPPAFDTLVVGHAPPGFADLVPLAAPLDPATTYTADLSLLDWTTASSIAGDSAEPGGTGGTGGTGGSGTGTGADALYAALGQTATFRPADLDSDAITYAGVAIDPGEFGQLPCSGATEEDLGRD